METESTTEVNALIVEKWTEVKTLAESVEFDVLKSARGNTAAGVRSRKGLRLMKRITQELVKEISSYDKVRKALKPKSDKPKRVPNFGKKVAKT